MAESWFEGRVNEQLDAVRELLLAKNSQYGDSALTPVNVFSMLGAVAGIGVRIDDKLARVRCGGDEEDTVADLIGYLILLRIAQQVDEDNTMGDI